MKLPRLVVLAISCAVIATSAAVNAADLQKFTDVRLIDSPANDGDSFLVKAGERTLHLRLYFVDCPEQEISTDADAKRVRDQARHFGITDPSCIAQFGKEAAEFTARQLAQPFTVHTAFADALGRSPERRIYAFVTTAQGRDLASLLVENGYARVFGVKRTNPQGLRAPEVETALRDREDAAMLKRAGLWHATNPDEIARLRAEDRSERQEITALKKGAAIGPARTIELNSASSRQLQSVPGIGPVLASRIIAGRPYQSVDDLVRVNGIGPRLLEKIRDYFVVTAPAEGADAKP